MRTTALTVVAILLCSCTKPTEETPAKPIVSVKTVRAETADLPQTVKGSATIFPRAQANVAARITAPIRELRARKGDAVRSGQVLAILENRDLAAQRDEAAAALADAQANLQRTERGTLPTDVERARGQVETTRATLAQAQKNSERRQSLFQQGAIPQRDLLQAETELATAKANYEVAQRSMDLLQRQSGTSDVAMAKARVDQARARLSGASVNLRYTELASPFGGTITEQFQYPGDMAGPSTPTYTVMDLSVVTARAQVPETSAAGIRPLQKCTFTAGDTNTPPASGRVTVINRAVDPARRTVEVWCEIANPRPSLRAGVFGSVSIETASIKAATVVPLSAVQLNEGTDTGVAFVVDQQRIAHMRDVQVGVRNEDTIQIRSGIQPGELVITEGGYGLSDGTQVRLPGQGAGK